MLRKAGVDHNIDVERLTEAYRERAARCETPPLAVNVHLSPVIVDAVSRVRSPVRRFLNLRDGELFELGATIGFVGIRFPF